MYHVQTIRGRNILYVVCPILLLQLCIVGWTNGWIDAVDEMGGWIYGRWVTDWVTWWIDGKWVLELVGWWMDGLMNACGWMD